MLNGWQRTSGELRRGEIWWAGLGPPIGSRPVLLISRDRAYVTRRSVTIAPITSRIRGLPVEVPVGPADGLSRPSVVNLDDIATVRKATLERRIAQLSSEKMAEVERAIKFALDLK